MSSEQVTAAIPSEAFPLLPLRRGVLLPGNELTFPVGRERSKALANDVKVGDLIGVATQRDVDVEQPTLDDMYPIGVLARVRQVVYRNRRLHVMVDGISRLRLTRLVEEDPYWKVEAEAVDEPGADSERAGVLARELAEQVRDLASGSAGHMATALSRVGAPGLFADSIASGLDLPAERSALVLQEVEVEERLRLVARLIGESRSRADLRKEIDAEVRRGLGKNQREAVLREQLKAIRKQLGEGDQDLLAALRDRLDEAELSPEAREVATRELRRLETLNSNHPEYNVARSYLELIAELPWQARADARDDLDHVARKLDLDHHGMDDVKRHILEHMAVLKMSGGTRGTILCLAGPPGVGKTSLGRSVAEATGRPFVRISLGGVRDEAELRGHRRTYIGALPGRIVAGLRKAGVKNPVLLLDEIDKVTRGGWSGDPAAALLEILDPEQNATFTDHYLELPFDLSEVLFICTANDLSRLSGPLRDRLEVIEISGYTQIEKAIIARDHLVARQRERHALPADALSISDAALSSVIADYTREAGVRQLDRELQKICRGVALEVARSDDPSGHHVHVEPDDLHRFLGRARFFNDVAERTAVPGVATGLAWTPVGGDILFIETTHMAGKGRIEITGQLGDVMKESARAALAYVRANADALEVDADFLERHDIHLHVPAGAVPKDGPSAGVTIFTALTSLMSGRKVRSDTAMTGEVTLRGRVLPVGGIKAKVLAAHRAGLRRVILPARNARDLDDIPPEVRDDLDVILATRMDEVLAAALLPPGVSDDLPTHPPADDLVSGAGVVSN